MKNLFSILTTSARGLFLLRLMVGLSLFFLGLEFVLNETILERVFSNTAAIRPYSRLHLIVPWILAAGGLLIIVGLFIRWISLLEILLLLSAIVWILPDNKIFSGYGETSLAILLTLLLFLLVLKGNEMAIAAGSVKNKKASMT